MSLKASGFCGVLLAAALSKCLTAPVAAAPIEPLPIEALMDMERLSAVDLSPDGKWVAVVLSVPKSTDPQRSDDDPEEEPEPTTQRVLQLIDSASGVTHQIAPEGTLSHHPSWSPDGSKLAFQVGKGDEARLWVWSRATRRAAQASPAPIREEAGFAWTPDGARIVTVLLPEGVTTAELAKRSGRTETTGRYPLDASTPGAQVAVYRSAAGNSPTARAASADNLHDYPGNNWFLGDPAVIDPNDGSFRRIAVGYRPATFRVSPNGKYVSFTSIVGQAEGSAYRNLYDFMVVGIDGGEARVLADNVPQTGIHMDASWSPRSDALAYRDGEPDKGSDGYVVAINGGTPRRVQMLERGVERHFSNRMYRTPLWDRDGEQFYTLGDTGLWRTTVADLVSRRLASIPGKKIVEILAPTGGGHFTSPDKGRSLLVITRDEVTKEEGFYSIDLHTGSTRKLVEEVKRHGRTPFYRMDASDDGRTIAFAVERADAGEQLWLSDPAFKHPRQLTRLNPHLAKYRFGRSRLVSWRGPDGVDLKGALLLPPDYSKDKRYPLVVNLYGDKALSEEVNSFGIVKYPDPIDNMQLLATRGYAVLRPDTVTRLGTPMRDIAASVLPAVDRLIEDGVADPERLGIMGHSYGGYSTLATIVQTTRFKAAVVSAGSPNLIGVYTQMTPAGTNWKISWAEESQGKMGGTLWDYRERYVENSPLFNFDRVSTPVLILHGTEDTAVPVHMGDEIFTALRRLGKEVEYAKYVGEPHVVMGRVNSIDYANRMIAWFDKHLRADSHSSVQD